MSDISAPPRETPADPARTVALYTLRPPATLYFTDTAQTGLKVKYVRQVLPESTAKAAPAEPDKTATA